MLQNEDDVERVKKILNEGQVMQAMDNETSLMSLTEAKFSNINLKLGKKGANNRRNIWLRPSVKNFDSVNTQDSLNNAKPSSFNVSSSMT